MCDLAFLHEFTDEQQKAICRVESMLLQRRIKHYPSTLSPPAPAGPSRDAAGDFSPLDRAGAGISLSEASPCS